MRTGDQTLIKELNKSIVINLIRRKSPISRSQISAESGLNKATVSSLTDELIHDGLVWELGSGHSTVGRRPRLLGFNSTAGYAIGVELGVDFIRFLSMDLAGNILSASQLSLSTGTSVHEIVAILSDSISETALKLPESELGLIGVGIGVPGLVDFSNGVVLHAPNLGWTNVPLKSYLEAHIRFPIFIDNEANTGALAELLFGKGKQISNFVYFSVGTGIGTGMVLNNNLLRGTRGTAGEFGHMVIETNGLRCSCGSRGCLEMYASEKALVSKFHQLSGKMCTVDEIIELIHQNDPSAISAIQSIGQYLGTGISNIINGLNPELVLIGNRLSQAGDMILQPIKQVVEKSGLPFPVSCVRIEAASLGRNATAMGAASLVLDEYFQGPLAAR